MVEEEEIRSRGTVAKLYFAGRMAVRLPLVLKARCVDSVLRSIRIPAAMSATASHLHCFFSIQIFTLSAVRLRSVIDSASARFLAYRRQMKNVCSAFSMLPEPQWSQRGLTRA